MRDQALDDLVLVSSGNVSNESYGFQNVIPHHY
jgi:hypothetical protein